MSDQELNATVVHRQDPNERLAIVRVQPDGWALPDFEPGQYAALGLPDPTAGKLIKRVYSIASAPGRPWLEFYLQLVKEGALTPLLWPHHPGDRIFLSPRITGRFTLADVPPGKDLVMVATGTGLAPFLSMLRYYRGKGRWRRCIVVHGARTEVELAYREELEAAAREDESICFIPCVTREPAGSPYAGPRGRVQTVLEGDAWERLAGAPLDPAHCHVFLCGNPAMIDDMEARLAPRGFKAHTSASPGNLHFERYW
jgi:ferredoxin/flavodoxin---NADP+ reductase